MTNGPSPVTHSHLLTVNMLILTKNTDVKRQNCSPISNSVSHRKASEGTNVIFTFLDLPCVLKDPRGKCYFSRFTSVIGTQNLEGGKSPQCFLWRWSYGKKTLFAHSSRVWIPRRSKFYFGSWRSSPVSPCFVCHVVRFVCSCFLPLLPLENTLMVSLLRGSGLSVNFGFLWVFLVKGWDWVRRPLCFVRLCLVMETFLGYYCHWYTRVTADKRHLLFLTNMLHAEQTPGFSALSRSLHTPYSLCLSNRAEVRYTVENQG